MPKYISYHNISIIFLTSKFLIKMTKSLSERALIAMLLLFSFVFNTTHAQVTFTTALDGTWRISNTVNTVSPTPLSASAINALTFPNAAVQATASTSTPIAGTVPIMNTPSNAGSACITKFVNRSFVLPCKPTSFNFNILGDDGIRVYINGNILRPASPAAVVPEGVCGVKREAGMLSQMGYNTPSSLNQNNTNGLSLFVSGTNSLVIEVLDLGGGNHWVEGKFSITTGASVSMNTPVSQTFCAGYNTSPIIFGGAPSGTTYTWINNNTAIGLAASGMGNIPSFLATNNGTTPLVATITVIPSLNGCQGKAQTFTITVNPKANASFSLDTRTSPTGVMSISTMPIQSLAGAVHYWYLFEANCPCPSQVNVNLIKSFVGATFAHTPLQTGKCYRIYHTVSYKGCISTTSKCFTVTNQAFRLQAGQDENNAMSLPKEQQVEIDRATGKGN